MYPLHFTSRAFCTPARRFATSKRLGASFHHHAPRAFAMSEGSMAALCGVKKRVQRGSNGCFAAVASAKAKRSFAPEK
jgi:hypothetical protein